MTHCPRARCGRLLYRDGTCPVHGELPAELAADVRAELEAERAKKEPFRPWTPEDEAFIRAHRGDLTGPEIAAALGRSHKAVKHWFERHRLSNPRKQRERAKRHWSAPGMPGGPWTDEELWLLEAGEMKLLSRSRSRMAIKLKATRLGIPLRSGDGAMSLNQVAQHWRLHPDTVGLWILRGMLPAKRAGKMWRIEPDDAERLVPGLMAASRANHGRKGWWRE
jgi:hypothetical protein